MLFFIRKRTVTLEISKLQGSASTSDVCHTSQSSEKSSIKKALLSQAEAVQSNQVHSRLNSVVQSIFNNFFCHFILVQLRPLLKCPTNQMFIQTFSPPNLCEVCIFKATMYFSRMNRANYLFLLNKLPWQPSQLAFSGLKIFHSIFIMGGGGKKEKNKQNNQKSLYCKNSCQNTNYPIKNLPGIFPNL